MRRNYGKVETGIWEWAGREGLSPEETLLAVYLIACPHSNSVGVFHLPTGYVEEDLPGVTRTTLSKGFAKLSAIGFAYRCERTKYIFIRDHMDHNAPDNSNVGKAMAKSIGQIPRDFTYWPEFIEALKPYAKRFAEGFVNGLSKGMPTPEPEPEPKPEPITPLSPPSGGRPTNKTLLKEDQELEGGLKALCLDGAESRFKLKGWPSINFKMIYDEEFYPHFTVEKPGMKKKDWPLAFYNWAKKDRLRKIYSDEFSPAASPLKLDPGWVAIPKIAKNIADIDICDQWRAACKRVGEDVGEAQWKSWLSDAVLVGVEKNNHDKLFKVDVKTRFIRDHARQVFQSKFEGILAGGLVVFNVGKGVGV